MDVSDVLGWIVVIVVIYLALRIGAVLLKVLLGLVAIALVWWLVSGLFATAAAAPGAGMPGLT